MVACPRYNKAVRLTLCINVTPLRSGRRVGNLARGDCAAPRLAPRSVVAVASCKRHPGKFKRCFVSRIRKCVRAFFLYSAASSPSSASPSSSATSACCCCFCTFLANTRYVVWPIILIEGLVIPSRASMLRIISSTQSMSA